MVSVPALRIETAVPTDHDRIAELTVGVYVDGELASPGYAAELADVAGRAERAELLVVRDGSGRIVGSVALVLSGDFGEVTESDDEAGFRMLVVDPTAQGRGIGAALVEECLARARAAGKRRVVISTGTRMTAAHRLYERLGFTRLPERDWTPVPGIDLLVYARDLSGVASAGDGGDQVALLEDLALDDVQLLDGARALGEHRDLHLHRLEDHQRLAGRHLRPRLDEHLPDTGDHLRVDLLDRHRNLLHTPSGSPHPSTAVEHCPYGATRAAASRPSTAQTSGPSCGTPTSANPDSTAPAARAAVGTSAAAALTVARSASYQPSSRSPGS